MLRKAAISGLVWTFGQQFGNQLIGFIVSVILARILLPAEFGLVGMIAVFVAVGNSLSQGGMTQSLIRSGELDQEDYSTVFYFNLLTSLLLYIIFFFSAPFIADFFGYPILIPILRIYCLTFIISAFSAVQLARLTKKMDFKTQTLVAIPAAVVGGALGVFLAYSGFGVWSLVWSSITSSLVSTVQLWIYSGWMPGLVFNYSKFKNHFGFGYKLALSGMLDKIFNNIYLIVIGRYFNASQVGFYTRAESLKQLPVSNISYALNKVTFPLFASIQDDDVRLKIVYQKLMKMVVFIITPILILFAVLAEPIFRFLFTEKWLPAVPYFQILCATGILYPVHAYNLNILNVKGRSDLFLKLEVIKKVIIVIAIIIAIPYGILALLYGQVVLSIIAFVINTHYTGKFINYTTKQQAKDIIPIIILAFLSGVLVLLLDFFSLNNFIDIVRIGIGGTLGLCIYLAAAFFLKFSSFFEAKKLIFRQ